jgi:PAS domain S-box-containing protein
LVVIKSITILKNMTELLRILMLEDSQTDVELILRLLKKEKLHFESRIANDKTAFIQALDQFKPHIVLADNSLPQFNAADALAIVRQWSLHLPFVLVTGTVSEEFAADIIKMGADDYILKDRLNRLPAAIEASLKQNHAAREKHEAELRLIQSEENYRTLVERVSDAFIALDKDWNYTYMNKRTGEMIGRNPADLIGKCVWDEFPDAVGSATYKAFQRAMEEQQYVCNIDHYPRLNLWQENHIYPSPDGLSIFIRDISDQKRAEHELQTARDRLFFHIENSPLGFIEWDEKLRIQSFSKRAAEIFGWTEEELSDHGDNGLSMLYKDDLGWLTDMSRQMRPGEIRRSSQQHRNFTRDGRTIWCEWFNSVSKSHTGATVVMSLVQDITERKQAEENLRKSEIKLKEAQVIANISNWEVDIAANVHSWSEGMFEIFGFDKHKVQPSAEAFLSVMHPDDVEFVRNEIQQAFMTLKNSSLNFRFVRQDGSIGYGNSKWKYELDEQGNPARLYGILQDITRQKEAENELRDTNRQLHSLSAHLQNIREEERIHIAREIHDELGQQLTGLKMDMSWLGKQLENSGPVINEKISGIIALLDETVRSVRRISSNLRPSILDDLGLIAALEWHSQEVEKRSEVKVDFVTDMQEPELPVAIATGIFRIYQEVLTNAIRHANAHQITSSLQLKDHRLVLEVKDDGQGMDETLIRNKKTLGLLGIKERTFLLGGKFDLQTAPGQGTMIQVSIPWPVQIQP